jgi:hypothetical protein
MTQIFVRQRRHVESGSTRPRFAVVAVEGNLIFQRPWLRRRELEEIAEATHAEIVYLSSGEKGKRSPQPPQD